MLSSSALIRTLSHAGERVDHNGSRVFVAFTLLLIAILSTCRNIAALALGANMSDFAVSPEKNKWLRDRMEALNIKEEHILEKFVRSSGKGGQKVNKTSSCVYLKHLPTGIEVKCMKDRSQSINRFLARRELLEKIEALSEAGIAARDLERARIRKQKARKKARAQKKHKTDEEK